MPMVSPDFVSQHTTEAAWLIGALGTAVLSLAGVVMKKVIKAARQAFQTLEDIKNVQTVQAENHLKTIQDAALITRDEAIKTNAKLDVLISIFEKK